MMVNADPDCLTVIVEASRSFLGYLTPAVIPHCHYRGRDQFLDDYKHAEITIDKENEWLLVTGVELKSL